ncbi:GNAT family N-acetyltransferase [Pseudolysinimonas sp.]|uniref:GNAT family N-acetyltransferase n=1 Tax=Pseudolysinimonas sp. TaxID=2680009 RepID=UPI003F7EADF1
MTPIGDESTDRVRLEPLEPADRLAFAERLQTAFAAGMTDAGLPEDSEPVPSDDEIAEALDAPGADALQIVLGDERVGGAVVTADRRTGISELDFLFVDAGRHGAGIGAAAWSAIEARYDGTAIWETVTPYFDQRNLHFYVNRCRFAIVEFFHPGHPEDHHPDAGAEGPDLMFRLVKVMPRAGGVGAREGGVSP